MPSQHPAPARRRRPVARMSAPVGHEVLGELEVVHLFTGAMPTGVGVSHTGPGVPLLPEVG